MPTDFGLTNEYARNARLKPALLVALPLALLAAALGLNTSVLLATLAGPLAAVGVTYLLANISRDWGVQKQAELYCSWGGKPSVAKLRHRDRSLNAHTRARYHVRAKELLGQSMPTAAEEASDPAAADSLYEAFSNLLLERTRDTKVFRLLFEELTAYGFRRNLFGLKPLGISIAGFCSACQLLILGWRFRIAPQIDPASAFFLAIDVLLLLCWLFVITPNWVRRSADAYAERLLAACEHVSAKRGTDARDKPARHTGKSAEDAPDAGDEKRPMRVAGEGA